MRKYKGDIKIIWGDLTKYKDVKKALKGVDYIIHIAALASPKADYEPEKAWKVNVGSVENILKAIEELGLDRVKLVYIGSVAQTGDRLPPLHWGRVGDPMFPSLYDNYAVTKIAAERKVIESGLKYWVSLRQTAILHYGLLEERDAIVYHQPLDNVLEWITEKDSGRLIKNLVLKDLPEGFWKNVYNVGGGESTRINNYDFMSKMLEAVGVENIEDIYEPYWFAFKNFHGQYYLDSDILDNYLDFRRESIDDFILRLKENLGYPVKLMKVLPNALVKNLIMKPIVEGKYGTMSWIKSRDKNKIKAFWGSLQEWDKIKSWDDLKLRDDSTPPKPLNHGYDEEKDEKKLGIKDIEKAAEFRGGKCLSSSMIEGDLNTKLRWECAFGHKFKASPRLVLKAGHWWEECQAPPWNYEKVASKNPFLNQVFKNKI